jgi:hypothetical protein
MEGSRSFPQVELTAKHLEKDERLYVEAIERVNEILKHEIDYETIGTIIEDICKRCFPDSSKSKVVFKRIEELKKRLFAFNVKYVDVVEEKNGDIVFSKNRAQIGEQSITFFAKEFLNSEDKVDAQMLIDTVIHELLHLVVWGHEHIKNEKGVATISGLMYQKFSVTEKSELHFQEYFRSLNEGLTELIKDAVYSEYQARKGTAFDSPEFGMDVGLEKGVVVNPLMRFVGYSSKRADVKVLINEIHKATGISEDDVFRSLVSEYFTNGNLTREELLKLFGEYEGLTSLLDRLSKDINAREYSQDEIEQDFKDTIFSEQGYIRALFGRDVVGSYNKKIQEDVY